MSLITPDFGLLAWMTIIFAIVFFIVAKFGFPLITGMVDKRNERINDAIAKAREAEESLSSLARKQNILIEETREEQARILREASEAAESIVAGATRKAQEESLRIMDEARRQIEADREAAMRELSSNIAELSLDIAGRVILDKLSEDGARKELASRMADQAEKDRKHS